MAPRKPEPRKDYTTLIMGGAVLVAGVAAWFGFGGALVVWGALMTAGFLVPVPEFTGKKDGSGRPTPAHPGEQAAMDRFRRWSELKWKLGAPTSDWLPGWPVQSSWVAGVLVGVVAAALPVHSTLPWWYGVVNGCVATVTVWQVCASKRRFAAPQDPSPGVRFTALREVFDQVPVLVRWPLMVMLGVLPVAGAVAGWWFTPTYMVGAYPVYGGVFAGLAAGALVAGGLMFPVWSKVALQSWRELVATRAAWDPRWEAISLKADPPRLVSHDTYGPLTVDEFEAHPSLGAAFFACEGTTVKLRAPLGTNMRAWVLAVPNADGQGQPVPGTAHPTRFKVAYVPADQFPDLNDPSLDQTMVATIIEAAVASACDSGGVTRYLPIECALVTVHGTGEAEDVDSDVVEGEGFDEDEAGEDETSPWAVYATRWVNPDGLGGSHLRSHVHPGVSATTGVPTLVDQRADGGAGLLFIGQAAAQETVFDPATGLSVDQMFDLQTELEWRERWAAVLKQDVNAPKIEHAVRGEANLGGRHSRVTVHSQPFVTLTGQHPEEFFGLEPKLKASLQAAPFVAVTGFPGRGERPGDRHSQAFCVYWSSQNVPDGPQTLAPADGSKAPAWVLAGRFNEAFKAARLAQPEVGEVRCLTTPASRGHIWQVELRLYGGVTLKDVQGAAARIRGALGSPWLRVASSADGCMIYAGEEPAKVTLSSPERDGDRLISLDWEQAWLDSKVWGSGGLLPSLIGSSVMPNNDRVQILDFHLPSGVSVEDVRAAVPKLRTATSNIFIDVREGAHGASSVRLLVSETNPIPERAAMDFDAVDRFDGIAFATGVEGEPVVFNPKSDPHALLAGVTGAGKSVLAQMFLYGFLTKGALVYVIDPVKGGADFAFAKDHAAAFAQTVFEAQGVLKAVYAEVIRRKNLNSQYGASSVDDLPEDIRPPRIILLIDEFTSLMQHDVVPPKGNDIAVDLERELIVAGNSAKTTVGVLTGKIAREARSANVTLLLGTQKLAAKMLDTIPGAMDLKTNLARGLLGSASSGDRASALRNFVDAPQLQGGVPKGRGLWESLTSPAVVIQTWFATQAELGEQLRARREPLADELRIDMSQFGPPSASGGEVVDGDSEVFFDDDVVIDDDDETPGELTWDDLMDDDDDELVDVEPDESAGYVPAQEVDTDLGVAPVVSVVDDGWDDEVTVDVPVSATIALPTPAQAPGDAPSSVIVMDVDGVVAPFGSSRAWDDFEVVETPDGETVLVSASMLRAVSAVGVPVVWLTSRRDGVEQVLTEVPVHPDPIVAEVTADSENGWWKIDALKGWLEEHPEIVDIVWVDDELSREDELGLVARETAVTVLPVDVAFVQPDPSVGLTADEVFRIGEYFGVEQAVDVALEGDAVLAELEAEPEPEIDLVEVLEDVAPPAPQPSEPAPVKKVKPPLLDPF